MLIKITNKFIEITTDFDWNTCSLWDDLRVCDLNKYVKIEHNKNNLIIINLEFTNTEVTYQYLIIIYIERILVVKIMVIIGKNDYIHI